MNNATSGLRSATAVNGAARATPSPRKPSSAAIGNGHDADDEEAVAPRERRVRSKSTAAVEIQRHIRGYIARKKIGQLLAHKVRRLPMMHG